MNLPGHRMVAWLGKAALKTHALQTVRDYRASPKRAKRLECVRFIGAFRPAQDDLRFMAAMHDVGIVEALREPPFRPRRRSRPRHRLGGLSSRTRTSTRTSGFMVPMHGLKAEKAFHEPDRHLLSPSLSSARSGGEGARRAGEEALRFMVPMHAQKRMEALHEARSAAVPAASCGGVSPPARTPGGTPGALAGEDACATSAGQFMVPMHSEKRKWALHEPQGAAGILPAVDPGIQPGTC